MPKGKARGSTGAIRQQSESGDLLNKSNPADGGAFAPSFALGELWALPTLILPTGDTFLRARRRLHRGSVYFVFSLSST